MTVRDLLRVLDDSGLQPAATLPSGADAWLSRPVTGLAYDSRRVTHGCVFAGFKGEHADGSAFAPQAIAAGAIAVVSDQPAPDPAVGVPWVHVADGRLALALLSSWYYGEPSRELKVIGITGTNGKTTTSYLVRSLFEAAGVPCGLIGTVQYSAGTELFDAPRTTPEAPDLQQLLRKMADAGTRACAMEVSSHALALRRVDGTRFAAAVFTNFTRDHLDFHGDMEQYFAAKRRLFDMLPPGAPAIVNADDRRGPSLAGQLPNVLTYGLTPGAQVRPGPVSPTLDGFTFDALTPAGSFPVRSRLAGRFNLYNLLAAIATGVALDVPPAAIAEGLLALPSVPGRFQVVSDPGDDVTVVVDYAHTDDALKNLLEAVRSLAAGRLITVFGCGGDRDRTKRPLMGAVAARLSDRVVLTSDNPRSEDPERIIDDIERGIAPAEERLRLAADAKALRDGREAGAPRWTRNADRRTAVESAILDAAPRDVVVVAGKGHEKYQVVGDRVLPFDDVTIARAALALRRRPQAVNEC